MEFKELLTLTQNELMTLLTSKLSEASYSVSGGDYYLAGVNTLAPDSPCLVAHLDTINTHRSNHYGYTWKKDTKKGGTTPTENDILVTDKYILLSPESNPDIACLGGDDRVGVKTILDILDAGLRPNILFTTNEEIGCVGSNQIIQNGDCYELADSAMFIQIDRGVHEGYWNEMVFYDYDHKAHPEIFNELSKYYTLANGSYTDVAVLGPHFNRPIVNLSASYMNEHTRDEFINLTAYRTNLTSLKSFLVWIGSQDTSGWNFVEKYRAPIVSSWGSYNYSTKGSYSSKTSTDTGMTEDDYKKEVKNRITSMFQGDMDKVLVSLTQEKESYGLSWKELEGATETLYFEGCVYSKDEQDFLVEDIISLA